MAGALFFGRLSDHWGRRNLFMITLGVYLIGGAMTALTFGHGEGWVLYLYLCRFIAGMGIGGEYAAINSAIDELIPSRYRGRVDIAVNGTYWGGAFLATVVILVVIKHLPVSYSWRVAFLVGPALGFVIMFVRRNLPESPRWLLMQGRVEEAESGRGRDRTQRLKGGGVRRGRRVQGHRDPAGPADRFHRPGPHPLRHLPAALGTRGVADDHPVVSLQRHLFHLLAGVDQDLWSAERVDALLFHIFAAGNLLGPLIDRPLLRQDRPTEDDPQHLHPVRDLAGGQRLPLQSRALDAVSRTACWCVIFFFASAGASAAYLTVSEIFPVEVRAKAIAVFFAMAQSFGAFGPWFYGKLIGDGSGSLQAVHPAT